MLDQLITISSSSAVRVEPPAVDVNGEDAENAALEALRSGRADVAVLRADTLATAGATSLSVLQLPLLVESVEHAERVAGDPIARDLLADLDTLDLVGVTLVPGGLRHPFGYVTPLLGPGDYVGEVINTRFGAGIERLLGALGATTDHSVDAERDRRARAGALRGIEVSLQQYRAVTLPAVVTSNVTLYTKFDVVVVRTEVWQRLGEGQRNELVRVAREAGDAAIAGRDSEADALDRFCATAGGSSVVADAATVASLRRALQPVLDEALHTPSEASLVEGIVRLGQGGSPSTGRACGAPTTAEGHESTVPYSTTDGFDLTPVGPQDVLDGVWRLDADRQTMIDAGVSPQDAGANAGVWTLTIADGRVDADQPHGSNCTWQFHFAGDRVSLNQSVDGNENCGGQGVGIYEIDGETARFHFDRQRDYDVALDNSMFADGMHRIG